MIKVMFIEDFSGIETDNVAYKKGDIADVEDVWLERLIVDKRATVVGPEKIKVVVAKPKKLSHKVKVNKTKKVEEQDNGKD